MPFKSQAQRRKFGALVNEGKMSKDTMDKWNKETGKAKLPERLKPKKKFTSTDQLRAEGKKGKYK